MQELRYILVALGGIAIAALLIHGLWSNRKNRQAPIKEKPLGRMESKSRERDNDAFDSDGIGQVRVVSGGRRAEPKLRSDEARQPEPRRVAPVPAFDDEDDDADLPPPVVRKPAARPVPLSLCMRKKRTMTSRLPPLLKRPLPRRCANLHR
jgi:cell division protein ZipA